MPLVSRLGPRHKQFDGLASKVVFVRNGRFWDSLEVLLGRLGRLRYVEIVVKSNESVDVQDQPCVGTGGIQADGKGIGLRFPRFLRIRDDKTAEDGSRTCHSSALMNTQLLVYNYHSTSLPWVNHPYSEENYGTSMYVP